MRRLVVVLASPVPLRVLTSSWRVSNRGGSGAMEWASNSFTGEQQRQARSGDCVLIIDSLARSFMVAPILRLTLCKIAFPLRAHSQLLTKQGVPCPSYSAASTLSLARDLHYNTSMTASVVVVPLTRIFIVRLSNIHSTSSHCPLEAQQGSPLCLSLPPGA